MARIQKTFGQRQAGLAPSYRGGGYAPTFSGQPASFAPTPPQTSYSTGYGSGGSSISTAQSINTSRSRPVTWMRYLAGMIDLIILCVLSFVLILGFVMIPGTSENLASEPSFGLYFALFVLWFGYGLILETSSWQATIGKKITGLIVTDEDGDPLTVGRAFGRACGKVLSGMAPFYISYTMMHWSNKNKTLHDLMAGTRVYKRSELGGNVGNYFD